MPSGCACFEWRLAGRREGVMLEVGSGGVKRGGFIGVFE